jgi:hypothetical protein
MRRLFGAMFVEGLTVAVAAGTLPHPRAAPGAPIARQQSVWRRRGTAGTRPRVLSRYAGRTCAAGLATEVAETLQADGATIKIERIRITEAGRRAIER